MRIATDAEIRSRSQGQVKKPETLNYRTRKPEHHGLSCARIFGPTEDFACLCGKYVGESYAGGHCEKCGVEIVSSSVRSERFGHIELAQPVLHPFARATLGARLGLTDAEVTELAGWTKYLVLDPGSTRLGKHTLIDEQTYWDTVDAHGEDAFVAKLGSAATIDVAPDLHLQVIPVLPDGLRPMIVLEEDKLRTHPTTDLYRRVVNRTNRLARLMELDAPEIIIRNECRMLQEGVDALFANGRVGKRIKGPDQKTLTSLIKLYEERHEKVGDPFHDLLADSPLTFALAIVPGEASRSAADDEEFD